MLCATTEGKGGMRETAVFVSHEHKCGCTHSRTHIHTHTHTQTHSHTNTHRRKDKHKLGQVQGAQGNVATEKKTTSEIFVASDT